MAISLLRPWHVATLRAAVASLPPKVPLQEDAVAGPAFFGPDAFNAAWVSIANRMEPYEESVPSKHWAWRQSKPRPAAAREAAQEFAVKTPDLSEAAIAYLQASPVLEESEAPDTAIEAAVRAAAELYKRDNYAAAKIAFDEILEKHPTHPEASYYKARILYDTGKITEALTWFTRALRANPHSAEYCGRTAMALSALGHTEEALQLFHRAVELNPRSGFWCYQLGIQYYGIVKLPEARQYLKAAITLLPQVLGAYRYLADIYIKIEKPLEAIATLKQLLDVFPADVYAHKTLAAVYVSMGSYELALHEYDVLLKCDRNQAAVYHGQRGACYEALNKYEQAETEYAKADALKPGTPSVRAKLNALPVHLLRIYAELVAANPNDEVARYELGITYLKLGGWREAYAQYVALLSLDPGTAKLLLDDILAKYPGVKNILTEEV